MTSTAKTIVSGQGPSPGTDPANSGGGVTDNNPGVCSGPAPGFVATSGALLGYARVSTLSQVTDRQEDALREAGCDRIFTDRISGTTTSRPQLDALWTFARPGDTVVILSLDRLGRNTRQLLAWVDELRERGIHLRILQLGVDTATPAGLMVLTVIAALAEMERAVLVGRVREGLASARARGRVGGRPASLSAAQKREVLRLHSEGRPSGELAELFGCSARTVRRVVAADLEGREPGDG
jgi:DNA invertase Pin-like site-specific DNA recombinase